MNYWALYSLAFVLENKAQLQRDTKRAFVSNLVAVDRSHCLAFML